MLYELIKKDFIIIKKYVLLMLIVALVIPLFMSYRVPQLAGPMNFVITEGFSVFMLLMYVSTKEFQFPKASALLCSTPYPRKLVVMSKYGFCVVIFAVCTIIYSIESMLIPQIGSINFEAAAIVFIGISLLISVYLPVQFKLGYEKTRFFFIVIIMAFPFVIPQLYKMNGYSFSSFLDTIPNAVLCAIALIISIILITVSIVISVKIYSKKDLI